MSSPQPNLPAAADDLIPHGPSMRAVRELIEVGENDSVARFVVPADSPFVDADGLLDEVMYIEMIAQTFAAVHGFHLPAEQRAAHQGLLIGVKHLAIHGSARVGDELKIDIHRVAKFGDFGVVSGEIHHVDGTLLATAEIKVWRPGEDDAKKSGLF